MPKLLTSRRVVLFAGFGGLLAIIALMAWKGSRVISAIEPQNARLREASRQREQDLDAIRFGLSESASEVRDYLLDHDAAAAARRRRDIRVLRARIEAAAARFGKEVPQDEAPLWARLENGIQEYWTALDPALEWDAAARRARGEDFLRTQVLPRHRQLLSLAETVDRVDDHNFARGGQRLAALFAQFRKEMAASALVAVALGALLAFVAVRRILDLEQTAETNLREVAQARAELQSLSQRLVAAQEEERRRVARELHDEVGQAISAVLVELGRMENHLPPGEDAGRKALAGARQLADRAVNQVRDMALLLRPSMLDDLGLAPALKWQAREVSRRAGIKVKVAAEDAADDLPDEYRTCIYRVAQEALNNAARHAGASTVRIDVHRESEHVRASVQDDGGGFDPAQERGMGILGMEERVKSLGGVFRIDSKKGGGTIVSMLLPLKERAAGSAAV